MLTDSLISHVWILFNFYIWHLLDVSLSIRFLSLCDKLQLSYRLEHSHSFYIQCYHKHVHHTVQNRSRKFVRTVIEFTWHVFIPSLFIREIIRNFWEFHDSNRVYWKQTKALINSYSAFCIKLTICLRRHRDNLKLKDFQQRRMLLALNQRLFHDFQPGHKKALYKTTIF